MLRLKEEYYYASISKRNVYIDGILIGSIAEIGAQCEIIPM